MLREGRGEHKWQMERGRGRRKGGTSGSRLFGVRQRKKRRKKGGRAKCLLSHFLFAALSFRLVPLAAFPPVTSKGFLVTFSKKAGKQFYAALFSAEGNILHLLKKNEGKPLLNKFHRFCLRYSQYYVPVHIFCEDEVRGSAEKELKLAQVISSPLVPDVSSQNNLCHNWGIKFLSPHPTPKPKPNSASPPD